MLRNKKLPESASHHAYTIMNRDFRHCIVIGSEVNRAPESSELCRRAKPRTLTNVPHILDPTSLKIKYRAGEGGGRAGRGPKLDPSIFAALGCGNAA